MINDSTLVHNPEHEIIERYITACYNYCASLSHLFFKIDSHVAVEREGGLIGHMDISRTINDSHRMWVTIKHNEITITSRPGMILIAREMALELEKVRDTVININYARPPIDLRTEILNTYYNHK
jgi:hypothetical protein